MRGDARPECRTWLKADLDDRFCVLLACRPRHSLRQGSPEYREYEEALDLLITRLRDMQAVVEYAVARAHRGPKLFQGANNLKDGPVHLATEPSISGLRREILTLQDLAEYPLPKRIARDAEPIREHTELYVSVPGYEPSNLDHLAAALREVPTRETNRGADLDVVSTSEADKSGESSVDGLDAPDTFPGDLERKAWVRVRQEQAALRNLLAGKRDHSTCALCGHRYPMEFLVAAHIKKRSLCSEAERRDLVNVAMLACVFGCDALYEAGWITVDDKGSIRVADSVVVERGPLERSLAELEGKQCAAHTLDSEQYFSWHRSTIFLQAIPQPGRPHDHLSPR